MKRRTLLATGSLSALHLFVSACKSGRTVPSAMPERIKIPIKTGFGPLIAHPSLPFDCPAGFEITVIESALDPMSDGNKMPGQPDGMACFEVENGHWVLLRNHELAGVETLNKWSTKGNPFPEDMAPEPRFSDNNFGGVSRVELNPSALHEALSKGTNSTNFLVQSLLILSGTDGNCAGGVVDNAWLSCEESSADGHGYAFVTRPEDTELQEPRPVRSWGRFHREAVALDSKTGTVYMTEDRSDGLFYRFIPESPTEPFGPGLLQALRIQGVSNTSPYDEASAAALWENGQTWQVDWVDIEDPAASEKTCRLPGQEAGATSFQRGEGIYPDEDGIWFIASTAGHKQGGQIFRFRPQDNTLELALEIGDRSLLSCPDNLCVAPWGDLICTEDNYAYAEGVTHQHIRGVTRDGQVYDILRAQEQGENHPGPEFTGPCFSPDGSVLFVNVQRPLEMTLAIRGPWPS